MEGHTLLLTCLEVRLIYIFLGSIKRPRLRKNYVSHHFKSASIRPVLLYGWIYVMSGLASRICRLAFSSTVVTKHDLVLANCIVFNSDLPKKGFCIHTQIVLSSKYEFKIAHLNVNDMMNKQESPFHWHDAQFVCSRSRPKSPRFWNIASPGEYLKRNVKVYWRL